MRGVREEQTSEKTPTPGIINQFLCLYTFLFFLYGVTDQKGSSVYIYQENLVDIQSNL